MRGHSSSYRSPTQNRITFELVNSVRPTPLRRSLARSCSRDYWISHLVPRLYPPSEGEGDQAESTLYASAVGLRRTRTIQGSVEASGPITQSVKILKFVRTFNTLGRYTR